MSSLAQGLKSPEVTIYLHNGTDVTGHLIEMNAKGYRVKTDKGETFVRQGLYQGLILNNEEEKKVAASITHDPFVMMSGARYAFDMRNELQSNLKATMEKCPTQPLKTYALVHFVIEKNGKIRDLQPILSSGCPPLDSALLKTIQAKKLPPLPSDFPFAYFPVNMTMPLPPPRKQN
ncbi:MAG: energy transducer TonB [Cyanobacteria bacterium]|nr:energy transducer TonB [Cyanobacteriota bacterium]